MSAGRRGGWGTLDEQNSTLGSEAKNRTLRYLIAFPCGLWLGRCVKLRDWRLEPRRPVYNMNPDQICCLPSSSQLSQEVVGHTSLFPGSKKNWICRG